MDFTILYNVCPCPQYNTAILPKECNRVSTGSRPFPQPGEPHGMGLSTQLSTPVDNFQWKTPMAVENFKLAPGAGFQGFIPHIIHMSTGEGNKVCGMIWIPWKDIRQGSQPRYPHPPALHTPHPACLSPVLSTAVDNFWWITPLPVENRCNGFPTGSSRSGSKTYAQDPRMWYTTVIQPLEQRPGNLIQPLPDTRWIQTRRSILQPPCSKASVFNFQSREYDT